MTELTAKDTGRTVWVLDPAAWPDPAPSAKFPGEWKIEKVNPRNITLNQDGRRLRCDRTLISTTAPVTALTVGRPYREARIPWEQGTIVRWDTAPAGAHGTLFVVIKDEGDATVTRLVLLGGDGGRYWRKVPAAKLAEVKPSDLIAGRSHTA